MNHLTICGPDGHQQSVPSGPHHPPEFLSMLTNSCRFRAGSAVSREDSELLAYANAWAPFGGPSAEDLLLRFGMSPSRFRTRVREIVARRDRYAS
ncbi:hypothetical protein M2284_001067 [Rhodococcus sp. LBL1]|nr:hypothetical protein [Rhodococcus sp. LBL1]MDH6682838.1 hypothetical protein [Rhodococcus sp. LBL2]